MERGGKILATTAILAVAACGMDQGKLEIRSTPSALAQGTQPVPERIAEARGQLALGNVGLALEAFRMAWREDPNSTDALAGMAGCYDRMGRFDLSRRYYETALSIAPADAKVLGAFAQSLQLQGLNDEAQSVRQEIAARTATPAAAPAAPSVTAQPEPQVSLRATAPAAPLVTAQPEPQVALRAPAPTPAPNIASMALAAPKASSVSPSLATSKVAFEPAPAPARVFAPIPRPELAAPSIAVAQSSAPTHVALTVPTQKIELAAVEPQSAPMAAPAGTSVTVKLPPARPVEATAPAAPMAPVKAQQPVTAPEAPASIAAQPERLAPVATAFADTPPLLLKPYARPVPQPSLAKEESGPRLERLSLGEIGLVTAPGPMWRSTTVAQTSRSTTVRFVPLREASTLPVRVRLLNAARVNRLAANTRNWLIARGWRGMAIGNAYASRQRSVILYSADTRWLAQRLSRQFGFPMAPKKTSDRQVMVLLGADAARHPALKRRA